MKKRLLAFVTFAFLTVVPATAADSASTKWTPPKTVWGDPDLQGTWTSDNLREVPPWSGPRSSSRGAFSPLKNRAAALAGVQPPRLQPDFTRG